MKIKCKGCDERHIGCHSECEWYKEYAEKRKEIREKIQEEKRLIASLKKWRYKL